MKHYGIIEWVDFARGVTPAGDSPAMREHLASGCPDCRQLAEFCRKLALVSSGRALQTVPDPVLQQAREMFPVRPSAPARRPFRIPLELVYDSLLVPAPAGLRSSWQVGWQALYRAGDCSLDLRVEPELHSTRAAIIGQVSSHLAPEREMGDLPVCLKSGKLVVAETRSNRFGEFQMEYQQQKRLQLCVSLEGGRKTIQVPVKSLATDTAVGERLRTRGRSGHMRLGVDRG
jgi:hypothetical protein